MTENTLAHLFEEWRPANLNAVDSALWEATALAGTAAFRRLTAVDADTSQPAVLNALAQADAEKAAAPLVSQVIANRQVAEILARALGREGLDIARGLIVEQAQRPTGSLQ